MGTTIHLHCQIGDRWCIACIPNSSTDRCQMSGDPRAVTCPTCQKTQAYRSELDKIEARMMGGRGA